MGRTYRQRVGRGAVLAFAVAVCAIWAAGKISGAAPTTAPDGGSASKAAKPTGVTELCADEKCHASIVNRKVMHGPTAQRKCVACHVYDEPREHRFKLAGPTGQAGKLCTSCHVLKIATYGHDPVVKGQCTGCHDPHGSDFRMMLVADPTKGLCQKCHNKEDFLKQKFVHGPVAVGACILCHEPHSAWQPKLLVKPKEQLCQECHGDVLKKVGAAKHVHDPVKKDCATCHDPHASPNKFQLRQAAPDLCFSCHADFKKSLADAKVVHGPVRDPGGCVGCHAPHQSELPKLQKAAQPASCLTCHNQPLKDAAGKTLTNMAELLKENPEWHGPIRENSCTSCHQVHVGQNFRLLGKEYPQDFYAAFKIDNYALCFGCHIPQMVLNKDGTGLTGFRNGGQNLHWLHVNREKGRTCRACHEVHASKRPFHIREAVPFGEGGWMLEINFEKTAAGGSCTPGCHRKQVYDRVNPTITASPTTAADGK